MAGKVTHLATPTLEGEPGQQSVTYVALCKGTDEFRQAVDIARVTCVKCRRGFAAIQARLQAKEETEQ